MHACSPRTPKGAGHPTLDEFIARHRDRIVEQSKSIVRERGAPAPTEEELDGLPVFIDQLSAQIQLRQGRSAETGSDIGRTAAQHGELLSTLGVGTDQVVHDYGAVCQAIMTILDAERVPLSGEDYKMLNLCLDEAVAEALSRHATVRAEAREEQRGREEGAHLGTLVHELRNTLSAVVIGFDALKHAHVLPSAGRTGALVERNLRRLAMLIDRSLADARLRAAPELRRETFTLADLADDIEGLASADAESLGKRLAMRVVSRDTALRADRQIVVSALSNLVQNALKFTRPGSTVTVRLRGEGDHACLEVEDECGGLPEGKAEHLFEPFVQAGHDSRGAGLGLAIVRRAAEAHGGSVHVRNKPGVGCVFVLELPL